MISYKHPAVSVVVPFYNAEKTLERAVRSIMQQSYASLEIILVNNNSSDDSQAIAESLSSEDQRIKILQEEKQGVSFAANTGNMAANGCYIARMDADDIAYPDRIEEQVRLLESNPQLGVASCLVEHQGHHENTEGLKAYTEWTNSLIDHWDIAMNRFIEAPVINPSVLYRRELLEMFGGYHHGDFPEDYDMWLRWLGAGVKIQKVPKVLLGWTDSDERLTRSDERYRQDAFYETKAKHLSQWLLENNHPYVWVWGAGRLSRKRVDFLQNRGILVEGYIDVKERDLDNYPCIPFEEFNWEAPAFILSYVGNRGARDEIRNFMCTKGKVEGLDFLIVA